MAVGGARRHLGISEGGWGWVVVLSTAISALIQAIMVQAFGVLYLEMLSRYSGSATATSWVGALNMVAVGLFGPAASALCNQFGCRLVGVIGGVMTGIGIMSTAFAPNLIVVYFSFGILAGSGICLTVTSGYILTSKYFEQHRAFAMSMTALGPGIGLMVFPTAMVRLFIEYGYTGATLILGAFCLNASVAAALFRPKIQAKSKKMEPSSIAMECDNSGDEMNHCRNASINSEKCTDSKKQSVISKAAALKEKQQPLNTTIDGAYEALLKTKHTDGPMKKESQAIQTQNGNIEHKLVCSERTTLPSQQQRPKIFDFRLLKKPGFIAMCFVYFNVSINQGLGTAFLPAFAIDRGIEAERAAFLLSIGGIAALVGVLGLGFILDLPKIRLYRIHIFNMFNFLLAVSNLMTPLCWTYAALCATAAQRGIFAATLMTQRATVAADLVGPCRVPSAFGLLAFSNALGSLVGRPLGGISRDKLGDFSLSFYVSGALGVFSSVVFLVIYLINQSQKRKQRNSLQAN